jgi:prepilin-type N-terminal cleavage/methylation domain-containing protein
VPFLAKPPRACGGFTLLEILLVLGVLALLAGAVIISLSGRSEVEALREGMGRLETAMLMARAEAANLGLRLRLDFDPQAMQVLVMYEPEPLAEPGTFVAYAGCTWQDSLEFEGIRIEKCEFVGSSAYRAVETATGGGSSSDSALASVTFEPDGSSDSVHLELTSAADPDSRRGFLDLDGLTGTISTRILTASEMAKQ